MSSSKVSIITPCFNRGYIIRETAESIIKQTSPDWEWVIVDDGSSDNSWQVLQEIAQKDNRIKIYRRDREPKGACTCRNIAVEKCDGDYLVFLDSDDVLAEYCVEQRLKAIKNNPQNDFIIFPMLLFKKQLNDMGILWNIDKEEDDLNRVLAGDPICQTTGPIWKKKSFLKIGKWNENLSIWQDVELHIRSFLFPVKYSKRFDLKPDVYIRISDDSLSRKNYYSESKTKSRVEVFLYAANEVYDKRLQEKYISGLRIMGVDVLLGCIKSQKNSLAKLLMEFMKSRGILASEELAVIKNYLAATKMKLYRLPLLYSLFEKKANAIVTLKESTLSKIKWQATVNK